MYHVTYNMQENSYWNAKSCLVNLGVCFAFSKGARGKTKTFCSLFSVYLGKLKNLHENHDDGWRLARTVNNDPPAVWFYCNIDINLCWVIAKAASDLSCIDLKYFVWKRISKPPVCYSMLINLLLVLQQNLMLWGFAKQRSWIVWWVHQCVCILNLMIKSVHVWLRL